MNNFEQSSNLDNLKIKQMEVLNRLETKAIKKKEFSLWFCFWFF